MPLSLLLSRNRFSVAHPMLVFSRLWDLVTPKVDARQGWYPLRRIIPEEASTSSPSAAMLPSLTPLEYSCAILLCPPCSRPPFPGCKER